MKNLFYKTGYKIAAWFLFVLTATAFLLSSAGICLLTAFDVYTDGGSTMRSRIFHEQMARDMSTICREVGTGWFASDMTTGENLTWSIPEAYEEKNTNLFFVITDQDGEEVCRNYTAESYQLETHGTLYTDESEYDIMLYLRTDIIAPDQYYNLNNLIQMMVDIRYCLFAIATAALLAAVFFLVTLFCGAGHREGQEEICFTFFDRIPLDLYTVMLIAAGILPFLILFILMNSNLLIPFVFGGLITVIYIITLCMALLMSFAVRAKAGGWWRNTLCWRCFSLLRRIVVWVVKKAFAILRWCLRRIKAFFGWIGFLLSSIPIYWKVGLAFAVLWLIDFLLMMNIHDAEYFLLWILSRLVLAALIGMSVINMNRLQQGAQKLAAGNLSGQIDLKYMLFDFKKHAQDLNSISVGMQRAVNEQLRSERMKTELITNVSHDIKTPLTSIVNYIDLLKKEDIGSERAREYLEVLDRQSARLKKLTEDLVEASKASTGNIPVKLERTDANLFLSQVLGEYGDRLQAAGVIPVLVTGDRQLEINADGKLLWRVFDNLMNNICKYAMGGTRAYLSCEEKEGRIVFSIKNVSRCPLNISSDELMERFVRGDSARSTEGHGLGLSIARSLSELQGGEFHIDIDGDLFKAAVSFPRL